MNRVLVILSFYLISHVAFGQVVNPVEWQFDKKQSGNDVVLQFKATMDNGWHLYDIKLPENGPIPTTFSINPGRGFQLIGSIQTTKASTKVFDDVFNMEVSYFSNSVTFTQKVKLTGQDPVAISGMVDFMACNDETCLPPNQVEFDYTLTPVVAIAAVDKPAKDEAKKAEQDLLAANADSAKNAVVQVVKPKREPLVFANEPAAANSNTSLWQFFLIALLAGLLGTITPCVFPMIPMTVSFFIRGSENRFSAITKGLFFGISIISIYTLIGVLVSLTSVGADFTSVISTHWIPNILFFIVFVVFSASFFGMFEIVLPSSLVNKTDAQADKGGFLGIFFMAMALVLVSFSCTGPIVGALLVSAAGGEMLKPILGMFGFGLAFALPFTIFAIFPSMLQSLPKSGGWMNSVKVVLGFVILMFSFKYLSVVDQTYQLGILSREIYLGIWVVLSVFLGLYLLGVIKFSHDSPMKSISVGRMLLSLISFVFAIYLFTGIMGAPLNAISSLIPPQTEFRGAATTPDAQSQLPARKYANDLHLPFGLQGFFDYNEGLAYAKTVNKPVLLDFKGHACSNCKKMEASVWADAEVLKRLKNDFVIIALYTDDRTMLPESEWKTSKVDGKVKKTMGQVNVDLEIELYNTNTQPLYVIVTPDGQQLSPTYGLDTDVAKFVSWLDAGKAEFAK